MSKILIAVAGAAGYVLGTKAGQQRYEQISNQATRLWHHPKMQQATARVGDVAKEKAPQIKDRMPGTAGRHTTDSDGQTEGTGAAEDIVPNDRP